MRLDLSDILLPLSKFQFGIVLDSITEAAKQRFNADIVVCYLYDKDTNTYALASDLGQKKSSDLFRMPRLGGPTDTIVRSGQVVFSNDTQNENTPYQNSPFTQNEGIRSVAGIPLRAGTEIVGVLYINFRRANMVTNDVLESAQSFVEQYALLVSIVSSFYRLSENKEAMSRLVAIGHRISEAITRSEQTQEVPQVKSVLDEIAKAACELAGANCAVIYPYDPLREQFYEVEHVGHWGLTKPLKLNDRPRSSDGMAAFVREERVVVRNNIEFEDKEMLKSPFIHREGIEAFVGVVLPEQDMDLGVLYVNFRTPHVFTADEVHVIALLAKQAGVALKIARTLEKERKARKDLATAQLLNKLGSALTHRVIGMVGTTPVAVRQIRSRLTKLSVDDSEIESWLNRIEGDTANFLTMASRLRTLPEIKRLPPQLTDINETTAEVLRETAHSQIHVVEQYATDLPLTYVPREQVKEAIANVVRNAVECMPHGGTVTASTRLLDEDAIEVSIDDNGPGMPFEKQQVIFDLFHSERQHGLGYGLWWTRTVMELIGGNITVSSTERKGSTFTFTIPVVGLPE